MRGYNKTILLGNLTRDPEVRYTASKQAVASFSVAVNRGWSDKNGEKHESCDFVPVTVWGKQAENCERYLKKGSGVLVEGRIAVEQYEKDGQKRTATKVVAASVQFIGGSKSSGNPGYEQSDAAEPEEIPFDLGDGGGGDEVPF